MSRSIFLFVVHAFFLGGFAAHAEEQEVAMVKTVVKAASGECLPKVNPAEAEKILSSNKITCDPGCSAETKVAIARVAKTIGDVSGGKFTAHQNLKFGVAETAGSITRLGADGVNLNKTDTNNAAAIAMMFGFRLSNTGIYKEYSEFMGQERCKASRYSTAFEAVTQRRNEFAEAFAAYMTYPQLLGQTEGGCEKAKSFFAKMLKENPDHVDCKTRAEGPQAPKKATQNDAKESADTGKQ